MRLREQTGGSLVQEPCPVAHTPKLLDLTRGCFVVCGLVTSLLSFSFFAGVTSQPLPDDDLTDGEKGLTSGKAHTAAEFSDKRGPDHNLTRSRLRRTDLRIPADAVHVYYCTVPTITFLNLTRTLHRSKPYCADNK